MLRWLFPTRLALFVLSAGYLIGAVPGVVLLAIVAVVVVAAVVRALAGTGADRLLVTEPGAHRASHRPPRPPRRTISHAGPRRVLPAGELVATQDGRILDARGQVIARVRP